MASSPRVEHAHQTGHGVYFDDGKIVFFSATPRSELRALRCAKIYAQRQWLFIGWIFGLIVAFSKERISHTT